MTDEEALYWFERRKEMYLDDKCQQAEDVAILAIRERIDRNRLCDSCEKIKHLNEEKKDMLKANDGHREIIAELYKKIDMKEKM